MKALILNSGVGKRMGDITSLHPKCMTEITGEDTILSRQLKLLSENGVNKVLITTGPFEKELIAYCYSLGLPIDFEFVHNPKYEETNYIYSMNLARDYLDDDIILMHGDLVFDEEVLKDVIASKDSCMVVSSTRPLPEKDFKAVIEAGKISRRGIEFFGNAMAAQPLYKFRKPDFYLWMKTIERFCEFDITFCYAENALNEITGYVDVYPLDVEDKLCDEIDNPDDLKRISDRLKSMPKVKSLKRGN